ncbi:hypothetical protein BH09PLA1_BH09PLA1_33010 [soil metagenome]
MSHVERRGLSFLDDALRLMAMLSSTDSGNQPLDYAPVQANAERRTRTNRIVRIVFCLALLAVLVAAIVRVGKQIFYLHRQSQCMEFILSPDTVVFHQGFKASAAPTSADPILWPTQSVFVHGRSTPAGERRLVAALLWRSGDGTIHLWGQQFVLASIVPNSRLAKQSPHNGSLIIPGDSKIFAGQPDAADPTHFTITYELSGRRHVIDGWVLNDGHVVLEESREPVSDPPATLGR